MLEIVRDDEVDRQRDLRGGEDARGDIERIVVDERAAHLDALRREERVGHAAADQDGVGELDQRFERLDFAADLRAAEERDERTVGDVRNLLQELELAREQQAAGDALFREEARQCVDRRMRAMARAECVVHVDVRELAKLFGEGLIVLLFACVEAEVFEQPDFARIQRLFGFGTDTVICPLHFMSEQLCEFFADRRERVLRLALTLRTSEVRGDDDGGLRVEQAAQRRQCFFDARCVGDARAVERNVVIDAIEHLRAAE